MAENNYYRDDAVFIAGRGAVLIGQVGAEAPELDEVEQWITAGAVGTLGDFHPLGYTSLDDLPELGSDTEGGEKKGSWENDSLRLTRVTSTDTITVRPIQWSEEPLRHRFGPGTVEKNGYFQVPGVYTSSEVSMLVIIIDGGDFLVLHWPKVASSPEDSIELDSEEFAAIPVKYTVLTMPGKPKQSVGLKALKDSVSGQPGGDSGASTSGGPASGAAA